MTQKIHIALLGKEALPVYYLIKYVQPHLVYLLCTKQSAEVALRLKGILNDEHINCKVIDSLEAFDLRSVYGVCQTIHTELTDKYPSEPLEVTYNITGGTKVMALGAYAVAHDHKAVTYYTNADVLINMETAEEHPLGLVIDTPKIFALQGQELRSYQPYVRNSELSRCCQTIMQQVFMRKGGAFNVCQKLRPLYEKEPTRKHLLTPNGDEMKLIGNELSLYHHGQCLFSIAYPHISKLVFAGRWWENLVADQVSKWSDGRYDVWQSVTFYTQSKDAPIVKNEIDILVNLGNRLLFIECKSGKSTQNDINKMSTIRRNYGSDKSISILISYWPINADLKEKAHESHIYVIDPAGKPALQRIARGIDQALASPNA